jgi:leader peptidase (prepilin peptidase)/N-methyltransferase
VEIGFIVLSVLMYVYPPDKVGYYLGMLVLIFLVMVALIDIEYRIIMHPVSIAGAVLGLIVGTLRVGLIKALIGGVVGFGSMWQLYMLGVLLIKAIDRLRGRPVNDVALGFGDVNLSGVLGLMLGWPQILVGLVFAVLIGGAISLIYILVKIISRQYQAFMALPYGPFLVTGAAIIIYFRDTVLRLLGE